MDPSRRPSPPTITLTSDFGTRDGYAAAMKGVILGICPDAHLVDITHDLPAHDIAHAAFVLGAACRFFPPETIHLAVVDPGVGTERRPLLLTTPTGSYVAPDNGLLTYIVAGHETMKGPSTSEERNGDTFLKPAFRPVPEGCQAYVLDREEYWAEAVSDTFHGRDVFAPVSAHLSAGIAPDRTGTVTGKVLCLDIQAPSERRGIIAGRIIYVDHFGNLVSNIRFDEQPSAEIQVEIDDRRIRGLSRSYEGGKRLMAVIGSHGYLEVALGKGSAAQALGATVGAEVKVLVKP